MHFSSYMTLNLVTLHIDIGMHFQATRWQYLAHTTNAYYTVTTNPTDPRPHKAKSPDSNDAPPSYTTFNFVCDFHPDN